MSTYFNSTIVQDRSDLALADQAVIPYMGSRNVEQTFATKVGDTVYARLPPVYTASEFSGTTSASTLTQSRVPITIAKHFYTRVDVTSAEDLENEDNFVGNIMVPGMQSLVSIVEDYGVRRVVGGFAAGGLTGSAGTEITAISQLYAGETAIFNNKGNTSNLKALVTPTSYANLAQLSTNISLDYNPNGPANLAGNMIGPVGGINQIVRSRYAGTQSTLTLAGTPVTNGTGSAGNRVTLVIDGLSNSDGDIVLTGQRFTLATVSGTFVVQEDAVVDTGAVTLIVKAPAAWTDGLAVTQTTAIKENAIFNPAGVAIAILPGMPGSNTMTVRARSADGQDAGFGIRVTESEVSTSTLNKSFVFDCFVAVQVIRPEFGVVVN